MIAFFAFLAALAFALVHLFAGEMRFLGSILRSRWLSGAGGVSVAYVFLHLLPELSAGQAALEPHLGFIEERAYLVALLGLSVFYGLERAAILSRRGDEHSETNAGVFWLHIASFGVYNLIIGYLLLHREQPGLLSLVFYTVALGLHFVVNDFALRKHHKRRYRRIGRWLLAGAVLAGWGLGLLVSLDEALITGLLAFLAGGVISNVFKEELPRERESSFWAFALGLAGYAALLIAL